MKKILIANRGEIAIRIARAAAALDIASAAVFSTDDASSLHARKADEALALPGRGVVAYLDGERIIELALAAGCDAIHPGYGFLSENAQFARRCAEAGIVFVGPRPELLDLFGDKVQARQLAQLHNVPLSKGSAEAVTLAQAQRFHAELGAGGAMLIKALAGGGGRGMRAVFAAQDIEAAYARCQSEAQAAFGNGAVYVEQLLPRARHIEVQIIGDGSGQVVHAWERECTLQRSHQKLLEIAPSPTLSASARERLLDAAVTLAAGVRYNGLGTFEFLLDADDDTNWFFIEANPRLQVEHTVTEMVTGIDLVQTQLQLAAGRSLRELGLSQSSIAEPRGYAIQARINTETMNADGSALPAGGTIAAFEPPSGPGVRVDSYAYAGYTINPGFDSLLAKLIVHSPADFAAAINQLYRALCELRIDGAATNREFLQTLLRQPAVIANRVYTRFIEEHIDELLAPMQHPRLYAAAASTAIGATTSSAFAATPAGTRAVTAPMSGRVIGVEVRAGDNMRPRQLLVVIEAMKMEHSIAVDSAGNVHSVVVGIDAVVQAGQPLLFVIEDASIAEGAAEAAALDPDAIRPDLSEVLQRRERTRDEFRAAAVARRHKLGGRTARENIDDLCDADSFSEYGALALASQRHRRTVEELIEISPADGMVCGTATVNADLFDAEAARCAVLAYDYTVFAGTQGYMNHKKKDRLFQLAEKWRLPVIAFAEGGGGRPGDDWTSPCALETETFASFARLSALVPLIGIVAGRCFAGNAALLGCCDVIIATRNSNIGMGGPAMIEGGGLGVYRPEEVGPVSVQAPNGVIDILVADEAEAVQAAKKYLGYFQGDLPDWQCADQRLLRHAIPENRVRAYDIRALLELLADVGSLLELRPQFGVGMITAFIRIEGKAIGVIANNPFHLGGAIDADAADKAARFMQLCDAFDIPLLSLCDTPGFMVGPEVEKTAQVRHVSRMFITAASMTIPLFVIVLRKGYGLGAQAMGGGGFQIPLFTVAWPTGEFGAMGLEGAVRLGYRKELEAIADPDEREAYYQKMVAAAYAEGKALNIASYLELDDVIDPMESRRWIVRGLKSLPAKEKRSGKKRAMIDTW